MKIKRMTTLLGAGLVTLSLAACSQNDGVNAATGAVLGGLLGSQFGDGRGQTLPRRRVLQPGPSPGRTPTISLATDRIGFGSADPDS